MNKMRRIIEKNAEGCWKSAVYVDITQDHDEIFYMKV
jgi:hypothetical protein